MDIPPGMKAGKDQCFILMKNKYGLVPSVRYFYVKLVETP
jgi:hypothetical protein